MLKRGPVQLQGTIAMEAGLLLRVPGAGTGRLHKRNRRPRLKAACPRKDCEVLCRVGGLALEGSGFKTDPSRQRNNGPGFKAGTTRATRNDCDIGRFAVAPGSCIIQARSYIVSSGSANAKHGEQIQIP